MTDIVANVLNTVSNASTSTNAFITHFDTRDPTPNDVNWGIQKRWVNTDLAKEWILLSYNSNSGMTTANWQLLTFGSVIVSEYVENTGTAVPSGGILNVLGTSGITTSGNSNTISISSDGTIATSYVEDTGTAVPSGGVLNIVSGAGISTTGAGNTVTISATGSYTGTATTSDAAGQTQTIISIPVTVASVIEISAQLAGIEATPLGVGGEINATVFRGSGSPSLLDVSNKVVRASSAISAATFNVSVSGNNLIVTVTGVATKTIEWSAVAQIVEKTFI